jgi:putative phage-type endonuclease
METKYPVTHHMKQGSELWHNIKRGKISSSNFHIAISTGKGRKDLLKTLRNERMGVISLDRFISEPMKRGTEMEPEAREFYEKLNGCEVKQVGFIEMSEYIGTSTDGLLNDDGVLEIKNPNSSTHLDWIFANKLPMTHRHQVQGGLWVTGRQYCDFVSYDPRVTKKPYWCIRVERDETIIAELDVKLGKFVNELKMIMAQIEGPKF